VSRGVRSKHQKRVLVGIITEEFPPARVQTRVPIHVFGVDVAGNQDRKSSAETGVQVGSDQWGKERGKPQGFSPVCRPV